jgi:putative molybdopterin biosynthesis protein
MATFTESIKVLSSLEKINILSEPKRMEIFQLLMVKPRTVSQLGRIFDEYPAGVRYHVQRLIKADLFELYDIREYPGYSEKYYSSKVKAIQLQGFILPQSNHKRIIFMGSHDLAFERLSSSFDKQKSGARMFNLPIGSVDGLIALRQGAAQISGCHLYDPGSDQYNYPFIKHFFPDQEIITITLAHRVQGIITSIGNPKEVTNLGDLEQKEIRFINRNRGSGTRIWLDHRFDSIGINPLQVSGYAQEVNSHSSVSHAIKSGKADVGIGLIAAAHAEDLDFIPLFEEQYDLVFTHEQYQDEDTQILFDLLTSGEFRNSINNLPGYSTRQTGTITEVKINLDNSTQSL